jgi:hypothetical protein
LFLFFYTYNLLLPPFLYCFALSPQLVVPAGSLESSAVKAADIQTRTLDDLICNAAMRSRNPQPPHLFRLRPAVQSILANPLRLSLRQQKGGPHAWEEGSDDA